MLKRLFILIVSFCFYSPFSNAASEIFPGDFDVLKPDTQVLSFYYYMRDLSGYYVDGKASGDAKLSARAAVLSYSYYFSLGGFSSAVSIVQPYITAKRTAGELPDGFGEKMSGFGDFYIINKIWPIATPDHSLAIANTFYFPTGEYNNNQGLNSSDNRWGDSVQAAWVQTLNPKLKLELIPEVMFYGTNKNYVGSKMTQDPTYSFTTYLRWTVLPMLEAQVGAQYNFGGEQSFDGIKQDNQPNNHRLMLGLSAAVSESTYVSLRYTKDFNIKSEMKIDSDYVLSVNYLF